METKTGIIQSVENKQGVSQFGKAYTMTIYTLENAQKYSTFDKDIAAKGFKVGDRVEIKGQQKGKYWNMESMKIVSDTQAQANKVAQKASETVESVNSNDVVSLLRQILAELKLRK